MLRKAIPVFLSLFFKLFNEEIPTARNDGSYLRILRSPVVITLIQIWGFTFILFNIKIQIGFVWSCLLGTNTSC